MCTSGTMQSRCGMAAVRREACAACWRHACALCRLSLHHVHRSQPRPCSRWSSRLRSRICLVSTHVDIYALPASARAPSVHDLPRDTNSTWVTAAARCLCLAVLRPSSPPPLPVPAVRTARFVPRKQWVVCGTDDMFVRVYNYNTMDKVKQFEAHTDYIRWGLGRGAEGRAGALRGAQGWGGCGGMGRAPAAAGGPSRLAVWSAWAADSARSLRHAAHPWSPRPARASSRARRPRPAGALCARLLQAHCGAPHAALRPHLLGRHAHQAVGLGQGLGVHPGV